MGRECEVRIRLIHGFWTSRFGLFLLGATALTFLTGASVFTYYYVRFSRMIDARLSGQSVQTTSRVYTAPRQIVTGQPLAASELASYLQRVGYTEAVVPGAPGQYRLSNTALEIRPSEASYFGSAAALRVEFAGRQISHIRSLKNGAALARAELEPELLTNLFDTSREKRRSVRFDDIPQVLRDALLAAEDKRFFEHPGLDPIRIIGALVADVRRGGVTQGASTLTMQTARSFFFTTERTWQRKLSEAVVALQLEQRFSKEQIFELYANEIYLGNRGSFAIHGFAEASLAYFGKDIRELNLGEAAFLAGIIRAPNRYSAAERNLQRAVDARDRVLKQMVENRYVPLEQAEAARKQPLRLVSGGVDTSSAPYFVDLVKDHLLERFSEAELISQSLRIYTTLDPALQRAASEAITAGMADVDKQLEKRYERWRQRQKKTGEAAPTAQVALVALDPKTGEIRALVGGRSYGSSQLNRALARRQPGSVFKPFVFAAAFQTGVDGLDPTLTPVTTVVDEPTVFLFEDKEYTPNNYGEKFLGIVTLRDALTHSLNNATVKVAEIVGYESVKRLARQLDLDPGIQATPSVALGSYDMTPLDVAGGYTAFANHGIKAQPIFLDRVVTADGRLVERTTPQTHPAMDPRVAFLVTSLMQDVVNRGTGATVRGRGFTAPAAGKTGTSHDGWFAGFTSDLLCVIWVGFDDNRELGLAGGNSAALLWAEFMKRAITQPGYTAPQDFEPPEGVTAALIDPETLQLATPACPVTREEYFVIGTEPTDTCVRHGGRALSQVPPVSWLSRLFGERKSGPAQPVAATASPPMKSGPSPAPMEAGAGKASPRVAGAEKGKAANGGGATATNPDGDKKKGVLGKLFGIFGSEKKAKKQP